jgi:predicted alpha/beta-fold hydrolase
VVGYSLGGHMTLCWALAPERPARAQRSPACARRSTCPPAARRSTSPRALLYLRPRARGLKDIYAAVARRAVPTPWSSVRRLTTIREWDRHAVVPRHGFAASTTTTAAPASARASPPSQVPALVVSAPADPMIPAATISPHVRDLPAHVTHRWTVGGGHVAFAARTDLGLAPDLLQAPGLWGQVLHWLRNHG